MPDELAIAQVAQIGELLKQEQEGYYIIPDISLVDYTNPKVVLLNRMLLILTKDYPQYQWWTTESYFEIGLRINWRLK